jgi:exopolysaccharide biosynthesis polyprenyl glycosylphosphotransferase
LSGKDATSLNGEAPFLPKGASLSQIVNDHGVDDIVLCCDSSRDNLLNSQLIDCKLSGIGVYDLPTFYEKLTEKLPVFFIDEKWLYFSNGFDKTSNVIYNKIKRLIDLTISLVLFVLFLPAFGVISLMIKLTSKGPVLFIQDRAGERYQNFKIFKFRTMVLEAEKEGPKWAAEGDPRITALGNILRKTRLDELPQLINVIKGDMSLIGPRPEREYFTEQLKEQIPYYSLRFSVKPGLTGWGQVNFPYGSSLEDAIEKLQYELYYIKNQSLQLDFKIFLKTVRVIMFGMGR